MATSLHAQAASEEQDMIDPAALDYLAHDPRVQDLARRAAGWLLRPLVSLLWRRCQRLRSRRRIIERDGGPFVWRCEQTELGTAHIYLGRRGRLSEGNDPGRGHRIPHVLPPRVRT